MFARISRLLIVITLAGSIGAHWIFLQSIAWAGMLVSYSQSAPLAEAVSKTFDGQHPCKLCKQIAKEKQAEKKSENLNPGKLEFTYSLCGFVFGLHSLSWEIGTCDDNLHALTHAPPIPPPRSAVC